MKRRKLAEFVIDPSSGQYSASRLSLLIIIIVYLPCLAIAELVGFKLGVWSHIAVIVSAVCGAYGANSAARVWRSGGDSFPPPPPPPTGPVGKAKPKPGA